MLIMTSSESKSNKPGHGAVSMNTYQQWVAQVDPGHIWLDCGSMINNCVTSIKCRLCTNCVESVMLKIVPSCKGNVMVATPLLVTATHFLFGVAFSASCCYASRKSYFLPCI